MYNIYNKSESYFMWDAVKEKEYFIGNEKDLITLLANGYRRNYNLYSPCFSNPYFDEFYCNDKELDVMNHIIFDIYEGKRYRFYDGLGRIINPKNYEYEAKKIFDNRRSHKKMDNYEKYSWRKFNHMKSYRGEFRRTPVEGIHNYNRGRSVKPRRLKQLYNMYSNPDFKEFNRGSHKDVPDGWWDDWYRHTERNWKSQRKTQWKER